MIYELITKDYLNKFGEALGIKIASYLRWNKSVDSFIERLNNNVFENEFKRNSINWEFTILLAFTRFMFNNNFNGPSKYFLKITPFINKRRYKRIKK